MSPELKTLIPLVLAAPLLIVIAYGDMRRLRIGNRTVLALVGLIALTGPFLIAPDEALSRLIAAAVVFGIGFAGFALNLWGGGDVKALAALMLFVPSVAVTPFLFAFSASMTVALVLVLTLRVVVGAPDTGWLSLRPKAGFPMGLAIGMSGLLLPPLLLI